MTEKVLATVALVQGDKSCGRFRYEIHQVENEGIEQFRLRLTDCQSRLTVRFAKTSKALMDYAHANLEGV